MKQIAVLAASLVLVACASKPSVSEFQCKAGDWETIGYRDGAQGFQSTRLLSHQEACGEYAIVPNREGYMAGWHSGVQQFCNPENGFSMGQEGKRDNGVCQGDLRAPFVAAYEDGRRLYQAQRDVNLIVKQLNSYHQRLDQIKHELVDLTAAQLDTTLSLEDRIHMLAEMESLTQERVDIKAKIPQLEDELYASEAQLEQVSQELIKVGYLR